MKGSQFTKDGGQPWPPPPQRCFPGASRGRWAQSAGPTCEVAARPQDRLPLRSRAQRLGTGPRPTKLQQVVEVGGGARTTSSNAVSVAAHGDLARVEGPAALSSVDVASVTGASALWEGDWPWALALSANAVR
jgi:hypothetical protein